VHSGNNAVAFKDFQSNQSPETSSGLNFIYKQDASQDPSIAVNLNAARVNAFYVVNTVHDFTYRYGFTESAFNFQTTNFQKEGRGNDRVTISVQDGHGFNNADFATPPEYVYKTVYVFLSRTRLSDYCVFSGQLGRMRMFLWTLTTVKFFFLKKKKTMCFLIHFIHLAKT